VMAMDAPTRYVLTCDLFASANVRTVFLGVGVGIGIEL